MQFFTFPQAAIVKFDSNRDFKFLQRWIFVDKTWFYHLGDFGTNWFALNTSQEYLEENKC